MSTPPQDSPAVAGTGLKPRRRFRMIIPAFPAFNVYSGIARITTALGPLCVATVANKTEEWDAEVIDENNYRRFGPLADDGRPDHAALQQLRPADVVGFYGGLTSTAPRLYELARFYREQGVITVAGGQHFIGANIAEALDNGIQYVVIGEGEETICELLGAIRDGRAPDAIAGLAFRRDGATVQTPPRQPLTDFDLLPVPDFSLLRYARLKLYPVAWVRGCGMHCEFCTVKGQVRCPAPEYVFEQISSLLEKHNARHFFVVDDLFGQNRAATLELCRMLKDYQAAVRTRLDLTVQIRLDKARDTELLTAMRQAGINSVAIGFESPIPEELAAMDKRLKPAEMIALSRAYHRAGFLVHGMFIFGYPLAAGASLSLPVDTRVRRFRRFIREARIDTVQVLLPVPLPGTEMTRRLAAQHRVYSKEAVGWEYYDGNFPLFEPDPPMTAEQMQAAIRKIMGRFYRFKHMFLLGLSVLTFPALLFSLHNIRRGWRVWYRSWRNNLLRFGGWIILRRWTAAFEKGGFPERLRRARAALRDGAPGSGP
jgi:radical SAM superfamily enzyme YgiQ (UPF0313 family)